MAIGGGRLGDESAYGSHENETTVQTTNETNHVEHGMDRSSSHGLTTADIATGGRKASDPRAGEQADHLLPEERLTPLVLFSCGSGAGTPRRMLDYGNRFVHRYQAAPYDPR